MFGAIVQSGKERSMKNKAMSQEKLMASQNPFSFYEEDKEKFAKKVTNEPPLIGDDFVFKVAAKALPSFYAQADV
jgi:hypothetical protein